MKRTRHFLLSLLIVLTIVSLVSCGGDASSSPSVVEKAKAFSVGDSLFDTLQQAVSFIVGDKSSKVVSYTIRLNYDVTDAGADIPDLSGSLILDFGNYTYTLSNGSKGIVINNPSGTTIKNGSITVASGASLANGTKAVITTQTGLSVSDIKLKLEGSSENGIEASAGTVELSGATEITTKGDKKTIVATENAQVTVAAQSSVVLTGSLKMQDNANINLGNAIVNLTSEIEKGEDVSFFIDNVENIKPSEDLKEDVKQSITESITNAAHNHQWVKDIEKSQAPTCTEAGYDYMVCSENAEHTKQEPVPAKGHSFSEAWTNDATHHWHAATCGHEDAVEKIDHSFNSDAQCSICGYLEPSSELEEWDNSMAYMFYESSASESLPTATLRLKSEYRNNYVGLVVVPNSFEGKKVTKLESFWADFPYESLLTTVKIPNTVEEITEYAFYGCSKITEVVFEKSSSLKSISDYAFRGCISLTGIEIPASAKSIGKYAFEYCSSLTEVSFEEESSLESIGEYAFHNCSNLKSIIMPSSVSSIGLWAFAYCTGLTNIEIPVSVTSVGICAFWDCVCSVSFSEGMTSIPAYALASAHKITSVLIPSSVTTISEYSFVNCSSLTEIEIPTNVSSIGEGAFGGCIGLTQIEIPASVTSLGERAFDSCYNLTEISFGDSTSLEVIYDGVFVDCTSLSEIKLPASVTNIGSWAFKNCTELHKIEFGDGSSLSAIGERAFFNCSSLTEIEIPASVTAIDFRAFENCTIVISFSEGMTIIPQLQENQGITSVTIPSSVSAITWSAFGNCSGLEEIYFNGTKDTWGSIEKAPDWNENIPATVVHCTDGDVDL